MMFDWIRIVCYRKGKYDFFTDECMLIHGVWECRKCHGETICGDVLMCGVLYGVMYNKNIKVLTWILSQQELRDGLVSRILL